MPDPSLRLLAVAGGGALGAVLRYLLSGYMDRLSGASYPWGTTSVNLLGALVFGLSWSLFTREPAGASFWKVFLLAGVLGGFTTFSTFAFETAQLLEKGRPLSALLNMGLQNVMGVVLIFVGFAVGDSLSGFLGRL